MKNANLFPPSVPENRPEANPENPTFGDTGVLIGRFQTPELHEGHRALFDTALARHPKVIVFLGVSPANLNARSPLDFVCRKQLLEETYGQRLHIAPLPDMPSDHDWSAELDRRVREIDPFGSVTLYGSRDSFIPYYDGVFPVVSLPSAAEISATELRQAACRAALPSRDFRAGVVYAAGRRYASVYPTVDIAIFRKKRAELLLAKKLNEGLWRFPGGFASPDDESFEMAALREAREECGELQLENLAYLGSARVDDWRYRNTGDAILTHLFVCDCTAGTARAQDDIAEATWRSFANLRPEDFVAEHRILFKLLKNSLLQPKIK